MFRTLAIALTLSTASLVAVAAHAEDRTPAQMQVSVDHVDFNNSAQVRDLYTKLDAAAQNVCDSDVVGDPMTAMADKACERDAVSDAVRQINQPQLSALDGQGADATQMAQARDSSDTTPTVRTSFGN